MSPLYIEMIVKQQRDYSMNDDYAPRRSCTFVFNLSHFSRVNLRAVDRCKLSLLDRKQRERLYRYSKCIHVARAMLHYALRNHRADTRCNWSTSDPEGPTDFNELPLTVNGRDAQEES